MDTKDKIIKIAIKLFVKQGFENTPTSQISKEAGVATGTLFHHFKTKGELVNEAYLQVKTNMIVAMKVDEKLSVREKLRKSWTSTIQYGLKNKTEIAFMMLFSGSSYITEKSQNKGKAIFKPFKDIFKQGLRDGSFKDLPQEILENTYYALMKNIFSYEKLNKALIEQGFEMVWDALKK